MRVCSDEQAIITSEPYGKNLTSQWCIAHSAYRCVTITVLFSFILEHIIVNRFARRATLYELADKIDEDVAAVSAQM
jgi:hypothetical protein